MGPNVMRGITSHPYMLGILTVLLLLVASFACPSLS